jgi:hypothetical protein
MDLNKKELFFRKNYNGQDDIDFDVLAENIGLKVYAREIELYLSYLNKLRSFSGTNLTSINKISESLMETVELQKLTIVARY